MCKVEKDNSNFSKEVKSKDGLQRVCKECRKVYIKKYYDSNVNNYKTIKTQKAKNDRRIINNKLNEIKSKYGCSVCPERSPECLDFHHIDPNTKINTVSFFAMRTKNKSKILNEVNKCIVLCSNCHRKFHAGTVTLPIDIKICDEKIL